MFFAKLGMYVTAIQQFFGGEITAMIVKRSRTRCAQAASFEKLARYGNVHIWGVSGRTIHFLTNYADQLEGVRFGVDLDPRKQGKYVPFAGQKILLPSSECRKSTASYIFSDGCQGLLWTYGRPAEWAGSQP